ncbi:kelch-like protein 25 [Strongylocentrotus purpuratus]|uniref:BTB domain-containing protein n=1 Tax=Strongylocentrotus purpuratus TaxID=7668 RepID=A0A7M7P896_STRPU|nr:kelch-like protein 25 [Strongylocentrotus purpuratus]
MMFEFGDEEPYYTLYDYPVYNDDDDSMDNYVDEYETSHGHLHQQITAELEKKERENFQNAQQNLLSHVRVSVDEVSRVTGTLYDEQRYSDVTLAVGDRRFHAHRLVLSAWSDVFKTMLCNLSCRTTNLKCQDLVEEECCEEFFGDFLKFLYTASVDLTKENVLPLALLADKYLVKELRELCDEFIRDKQNDAQEVVTFIRSALKLGMHETVEVCLQSLLCNFSFLKPDQLLSLKGEHLIYLLDSGPRLMVDDEFTLFKKIEPWLDQCQSEDTLLSIIKLIRFPYMNALQLKKATETPAFRRAQEMMPDILLKSWQQQALYKEGSLDDLPEDFPWPRLYLNPSDEARFPDQKCISTRDQPMNEPIAVHIDGSSYCHTCLAWEGKRIGQKHFFKQASTFRCLIKLTQSPDSPNEVNFQINTYYEDSRKILHLGVRALVHGATVPIYFSKCLPLLPSITPYIGKVTSRDTQFTFPIGISDPEIMTLHVTIILEDEDEKTT